MTIRQSINAHLHVNKVLIKTNEQKTDKNTYSQNIDPKTTSKKTPTENMDAATAKTPEVTPRRENKNKDAKESAKKVKHINKRANHEV